MFASQFAHITVDLVGKLDITGYCILDHDKADSSGSILQRIILVGGISSSWYLETIFHLACFVGKVYFFVSVTLLSSLENREYL
jgi:hypothetical protein